MKTSPEGVTLSSSEAAVRELFAEMENILPHPNEPHGRAATRVRLAMENVRCAFKSEVSPIPAPVEAEVVERALAVWHGHHATGASNRDAMRAALSVLPPAPAWRPIETAPRDRFILVYTPPKDEMDGFFAWAKWQAGGWFGVDDGGLRFSPLQAWDRTTHWMLPSPPGGEGEGK